MEKTFKPLSFIFALFIIIIIIPTIILIILGSLYVLIFVVLHFSLWSTSGTGIFYNQFGVDVIADHNNNVIMTTEIHKEVNGGDVVETLMQYGSITKFSSSGQLLWNHTLQTCDFIYDKNTLKIDNQNNILVLCGNQILKFFPNGTQRWATPLNSPENIPGNINHFLLTIDSKNDILVLSQRYPAQNYLLSEILANGTILWDKTIFSSFIYFEGATIDNESNIYTFIYNSQGDTYLQKYFFNGSLAWNIAISDNLPYSLLPPAVLTNDTDGNVLLIGYNSNSNIYFVSKIFSNGTIAWNRNLNNTLLPESIVVNSENDIYLTGKYSYRNNLSLDGVFVSELNSSGNILWTKNISQYGEGASITLDNQNNILLTGATNSPNFPTLNAYNSQYENGYYGVGYNAIIVKLDSAGTILWSTYYYPI